MRPGTIRRLCVAAFLATSVIAIAPAASAAVPPTITNQGRLFDENDEPIDGPIKVLFAIYDAADAEVPIWSEEHTVTFDQGYYSVSLGDTVPFGDKVFNG